MSVAWTHKIQEQQADIYFGIKNRFDILQIGVSVLSTSGIIAAVFREEMWIRIVGAIASGISLYVTAYCKKYDLGTLYREHKDVALEWLELREDFISILCDIKMERFSYEELLVKRDELLERKLELSKRTPDASNKAVNKASKCLKVRQDNTYTDEEINNWLPSEARKLKQENVR